MEVQDKTCWTIALISTVVSKEAKNGPIGTDRSEGHIPTTRGGRASFYSCMNFYNLWQTEISWPLARKKSQRVPFEDWNEGCPKVNCEGAVIAAMEGYGGKRGYSQHMVKGWHVISRPTILLEDELLDCNIKRSSRRLVK